jgi:6-phosphogluconolactonase
MAPSAVRRRGTARGPAGGRRVEQVFLSGEALIELRVYPGAEQLAVAAADEFAARARDAVSERGRFAAALPGGSTPNRFYEVLAARRRGIPWGKVHLFWGDERFVPPDHPDSNFRAARELLVARIPIPQANVHPIGTEGNVPETAASLYEQNLRVFFGLPACQFPRFDLVILGLGADGHTASLFPGSDALQERARLVAAPLVATLGAYRITLTLPVLNNARAVMFLVSGGPKAEALARALEGHTAGDDIPSRLVRPREGTLLWMVDRAAAAGLHRQTPAPP